MECKACGVWFVSDDKSGVCHTCKQTLKNMGLDLQYDRLRELVQADREGRCVVLPISVPSMAYTVNPKEKYISTGIYMTPGSVLHDTERGYIIAKTYEVAEATLKEREKNEP